MSTVPFVNCFEVPSENESDFLAVFQESTLTWRTSQATSPTGYTER
jgi:hypothetical protein